MQIGYNRKYLNINLDQLSIQPNHYIKYPKAPMNSSLTFFFLGKQSC